MSIKKSYKEYTKVDRYELIELLESHTMHFQEIAEKHGDAIELRNNAAAKLEVNKTLAKDKLERKRAELDDYIRRNWEDEGFSKSPSDKAVEAWIINHKEYQKELKNLRIVTYKCTKEVNKYEAMLNHLKNAKETMEHRKHSLDNLVRTHAQGLWSMTIPRDVKKEVGQAKEEEVREEIDKKLKRRGLRKE